MATLDKRGWGIYNYTTAGAQEKIDLPAVPGGFTLQLTPSGGTARVEASLDEISWESWPAGNVSISTTGKLSPVRFLRVINGVGATSRLAIRGY